MIQDIFPHKFDNSFHIRAPKEDDFALSYSKEGALLKICDGEPQLPTFADFGPGYAAEAVRGRPDSSRVQTRRAQNRA